MSERAPHTARASPRTDIDTWLGARIRHERESRGWSLADLAARSGVSKAQVGKVESGSSSPTASLLGRLSAAFGLTVSTLLARAEVGAAGRVVRFEEHPVWEDPDTHYVRRQISHSSFSQLPFELTHVELPPGATVHYPDSAFVFLRQVVLVLHGRLTFTDGDLRHELQAGDSIELGEPAERTFHNSSSSMCSYLVALSRT